MEFSAPADIDFDDTFELNVSFLRLLRRHTVAARLLGSPADPTVLKLASLSAAQLRRLARCPFLLCCCREHDIEFWGALLAVEADNDLFRGAANVSAEESRIISATLGFAWQLARTNPFAARMVCGASTAWCEEIAAQPLIRVVTAAAQLPDVLSLRCATDKSFWSRLLTHGLDKDPATRRAARLTALNSILLRERPAMRMATAARSTNVPLRTLCS